MTNSKKPQKGILDIDHSANDGSSKAPWSEILGFVSILNTKSLIQKPYNVQAMSDKSGRAHEKCVWWE